MRIVLLVLISLFFFSKSYSNELNLFTSRHYPSDLILFKKFEEKTGIKVNVINAKSKVLEKRLLDEGSNSKGDVLFLDLDLVITGNLDRFFDYKPGNYCVIEKLISAFLKKK